MIVMIPLILAARKIDGEDPNIVYWLRIAYFSVQAIIVMLVAYVYIQAAAAAKGKENRMVYVPAPAQVRQKVYRSTYVPHDCPLTSLTSTLICLLDSQSALC